MRIKSDKMSAEQVSDLRALVASPENQKTATHGRCLPMLEIVRHTGSGYNQEVELKVDCRVDRTSNLPLLIRALRLMGVEKLVRVGSSAGGEG